MPQTQNLGALPAAFVPNVGQSPPKVRFQTHGLGGKIFFTSDEIVLALPSPELAAAQRDSGFGSKDPARRQRIATALSVPPSVLRLRFANANVAPSIAGSTALTGTTNFLIGSDPKGWQADVPTYAGITYQSLYPGIDLHYDGSNGQIESTYTVAPGSNPAQLRWSYAGAKRVSIDTIGNLNIELAPPTDRVVTEDRVLTELAPVAWQAVNGKRVAVTAGYAVAGDQSIGFTLGAYDPAYPLTIDPLLTYSTYLGGSSVSEQVDAIAVDNAGGIYVTGYTYSPDFALPGAYQASINGSSDAFITKIQNGVRVYSTYLGGSSAERGYGIAVDSTNQAYVTGFTSSTNFPTPSTVNGYDKTANGSQDAFITKLNANGNGLLYSSYIGASGDESSAGIALSGSNAYIVGVTTSTGTTFPTKRPYSSSNKGGVDIFVAELNTGATGSTSLIYSTLIGSPGDDYGQGIAVDSSGSAYIAGYTSSTTFPTKNPYSTCKSNSDPFLVKFGPLPGSGNLPLSYSTCYGGTGDDAAYAVTVDRATSTPSAYVTGYTFSSNTMGFPLKNAYDSSYNGGGDIFVSRFDATASGSASLLYSTYLGGSGFDQATGIATLSNSAANLSDGRVALTGLTQSTDFPIWNAYPMQSSKGGGNDAFVARLDTPKTITGSLLYSAYLGGASDDQGTSITMDSYGTASIGGQTFSSNFPTVNPQQATLAGADGFVSQVDPYATSSY